MRPTITDSLGCLFRLGWATLIVIAVLALIRAFIFDIMPVSGESMHPNFQDRDIIILNKLGYLRHKPERGDSVVLRFPGDPEHQRYIKRIIALPGERITIREGFVYVNGERLAETYLDPNMKTFPAVDTVLGPDHYFLIGDNRPVSSDSRIWGTASSSDFIGKAFAVIHPFNRFGPVPSVAY